MRKTTSAVAALAVAGAALTAAAAAHSQPYGYYPGYSNQYGYRYSPPQGYDAYGRYVAPTPYYNGYNGYSGYNNGYYSGDSSLAGVAGALLGSVLGNGYGNGYGYGNVPYDQYGADPNGMIGPDGRRIKCKLRQTYDSYARGYVTRRECWSS